MGVETWGVSIVLLGLLSLWNLYQTYQSKEIIMALAEDLQEIKAQLDKAAGEISGKISELEDALAHAGEQTQEVNDASL